MLIFLKSCRPRMPEFGLAYHLPRVAPLRNRARGRVSDFVGADPVFGEPRALIRRITKSHHLDQVGTRNQGRRRRRESPGP